MSADSRTRCTKVLDVGDDTFTESCEGAVNFMVIETRGGSLQHSSLLILWVLRLARVFQAEEVLAL
jgi:hypothetical protein